MEMFSNTPNGDKFKKNVTMIARKFEWQLVDHNSELPHLQRFLKFVLFNEFILIQIFYSTAMSWVSGFHLRRDWIILELFFEMRFKRRSLGSKMSTNFISSFVRSYIIILSSGWDWFRVEGWFEGLTPIGLGKWKSISPKLPLSAALSESFKLIGSCNAALVDSLNVVLPCNSPSCDVTWECSGGLWSTVGGMSLGSSFCLLTALASSFSCEISNKFGKCCPT